MMLKHSVGIVILLLVAAQTYGQQPKKESYSKLKSRSTKSNIELQLDEAEALKNKNPDAALSRVQEALAMSIAQKDEFNEARCYLLIAQINEGIVEWRLASDNYLRAYDILHSYPSSKEYHVTLSGLGNTALKMKDYQQSLKYYNELLALDLQRGDRKNYQLELSEVYYQMGQYEFALRVLESIAAAKAADATFESRLQSQKAKIYAQLNDLPKTQESYSNSLNTLRSGRAATPQEEKSLQESKEDISNVLQEQKLYDQEIDLRQQSIDYNMESNNLPEVAKDKLAISKTLDAKGETNAAIKEAEEAVIMADTINSPKDRAHALRVLANLYDKNGQAAKALSTYKKYSDAVLEVEKTNQAASEERTELLRKQKGIEELNSSIYIGQREETLAGATMARQRIIIYGLLIIIGIIGVTSYFIYKNARASKIANQLLALKSLRSQMNPHFIFNALNSVNHFISQEDERTANRFLSEFSMLMRLVLENSQEDFITLANEKEILSLYLKLEHYRFRDKFDYQLHIEDSLNLESIHVPPMLIQPYIENAVWHGLRYKENKGYLLLDMSRSNGDLIVKVQDDGIGRKRSAELKTSNQKKHSSTGLRNIEERLKIINTVYKVKYTVAIEDLSEVGGTSVTIRIPITTTHPA